MKIAISDANIFIDLIAIDLIDQFFKLPLDLHTTDLVINELDHLEQMLIKEYQQKGSLLIKKMNIDELQSLQSEVIVSKKLSKPDISIYAYAKSIDAIILTSDKPLRKEATAKGFEVHGILWLFEKLIDEDLLTKKTAADKMHELMTINTWLPKTECHKRINIWMS
jgi:rRNA-processing protein FCF1